MTARVCLRHDALMTGLHRLFATQLLTRRELLARSGMGLGMLALGGLFQQVDAETAINPLAPKQIGRASCRERVYVLV